MGQRERVLRALRQAGARGITQVDFLLPGVYDGGKPIPRVAARIGELRNREGFRIESRGVRGNCAVYVLVEVSHDLPADEPQGVQLGLLRAA